MGADTRGARIALVQHKAGDQLQENRERGLQAVREAASRGAQLVVFPELSFLPFFPQKPDFPQARDWAETIPGPTTDLFSRLARELGVIVILNLFEKEGGDYFDTSPVIDSDGSLLGKARMVHIIEAPCFHETRYYTPGRGGERVFQTRLGKVGVAICYDRHYPEYMRLLALEGAELVVVPQAGARDEWPAGIFEGELQVASFQNGYFTALANRVGREECLEFAGGSFVVDPWGVVQARAPEGKEFILYADLDFRRLEQCPAHRHFLPDRRPLAEWVGLRPSSSSATGPGRKRPAREGPAHRELPGAPPESQKEQ